MSYATLKKEAAKRLLLAATYAEDGAIETAIVKTQQALVRLHQAKTEKAHVMSQIGAVAKNIKRIGTLVSLALILAVAAPAQTTYKVVHDFTGNGAGSSGQAFVSDAGSFYGAGTSSNSVGLLYWITPPPANGTAWSASSVGLNLAAGICPCSPLISDGQGNLYGTSQRGRSGGYGTVFQLVPGAHKTGAVLYSFTGGADGSDPAGGLVFDTEGNLYGTTVWGGAFGYGTVYELTPNGGTWTETVMHSFSLDDGANPGASLVLDSLGNLYGTTMAGGSAGGGTAFEISAGALTVLYSFGAKGATDGQIPSGPLVFDPAGNLYGTTETGGTGLCANGPSQSTMRCGTVFKLSPLAGGWTEQVIHEFNGSKGAFPLGTLAIDGGGNLYGSTLQGGAFYGKVWPDYGIVFKLSPTEAGGWIETVLHNFNFNGKDGYAPGGIVLVSGGLLGTTLSGGTAKACGVATNGFANGCGTAFQITLP